LRRIFSVSLILILTISACQKRGSPVEYLTENGIDVVASDPGRDKAHQPKIFGLEQELRIDLSATDLVQRGLTDPAAFDVDSEGNIVVWSQSSNDLGLFKFSSRGVFLSAFGRTGQGPGEVQFLTSVFFDADDELMVVDSQQRKTIIFDGNGVFLRQNPLSKRPAVIMPLKNGHYVTVEQRSIPGEVFNRITIDICGPDLHSIKEIGQRKYYRPNPERRFPAINPTGLIGISKNYVFFGDSENGYEIKCFEKSGRLRRIIRKVHRPVPLSADNREDLVKKYERFPPEIRNNVEYPDVLPPFQTGFADEEDRLFVMTYEGSGAEGHYWHDIFDKDGVFAGRVSIANYGTYGKSRGVLFTLAREGRIYHFRENRDGFKELVIWKMK